MARTKKVDPNNNNAGGKPKSKPKSKSKSKSKTISKSPEPQESEPEAVAVAEGSIKKKKKNKNYLMNFKTYIHRVFRKEVAEDHMTVSRKTMDVMDSFMRDIFERIMSETVRLVKKDRKQTVSVKDISTATKLLLTPFSDLAKYAEQQGRLALERYNNSYGEQPQ